MDASNTPPQPIKGDTSQTATIERFIAAYSKYLGQELKVVRERERPDAEVRNLATGETIGVEVTGVFADTRQAMIQYSRIEWEFAGSENWPDLVAALQRLLGKKARLSETYEFEGRMVLAIYVGSIYHSDVHDVVSLAKSINPVPQHRYSEIWLMARDGDGRNALLVPLHA